MQTISDSDKTLLRSRGKITLKLYLMGVSAWKLQDYEVVSAKYTQSLASTSDFSIGNACSASLEITIATGNDSLSTLGRLAKVTWKVNETEYPLIEGYVDSSTRKNYQTTLTIYDYMYTRGQVAYNTDSTTATARSLISSIASQMSLSVESSTLTKAEKVTIVGGLSNLGSSVMCYSALANIACCMGGNFLINRNGELEFRRWESVDFTDDPYEDNLDWDAEPFQVTGISVKRTNKTTTTDSSGYTSETSTELTYEAGDTVNISLECNIADQTIANYMYTCLKDYKFYGGSTSFSGCLDIEAGDIVTVNSQYQKYEIAINEIVFEYDGGCKANITSVGSSTSESVGLSSSGSVSQSIQNLQSDYGNFKTLVSDNFSAQSAQIVDLEAKQITTDYLKTNYATIDFANVTNEWVENGTIKDGAIKDAQILSLTGNKITAGQIDAAKVTITNLSAKSISTGELVVGGIKINIDEDTATINGGSIVDGTVGKQQLSDDVLSNIQQTVATWTADAIPTMENYPTTSWDESEYANHDGDLVWVRNENNKAELYTYQFYLKGGTYVGDIEQKSTQLDELYTVDELESNSEFGWKLISSGTLINSLQEILDRKGNLDGIASINVQTSSFITNTEEELSSTKQSLVQIQNGDIFEDETIINKIGQEIDKNYAEISTLNNIEYTDSDETKHTGLSNVVSAITQEQSSISQTIKGFSSDEYTKEDGTTVTGIENVLTSVITDLQGYKSTVGKTYYTKKEIDGNSYATTGYTGTVIDQAKSSILLEAKSYTSTEIHSNIENRNLIMNADFSEGAEGWSWDGTDITESTDNFIFSGSTLTQKSTVFEKSFTLYQTEKFSVTPGEKLTFSGQYHTTSLVLGNTDAEIRACIYFYDSNNAYVAESKTILLDITENTPDWTDINITITVPASESIVKGNFGLLAVDYKGSVVWKTIQLEHGSVKTNFSHSQLDYSTKKETAAALKISSDQISTYVKSSEFTSDITQNADAITAIITSDTGASAMASATSTQIRTYVKGTDFSSDITQNSDAISRVVKSSTAQSLIKQTTNSIVLNVNGTSLGWNTNPYGTIKYVGTEAPNTTDAKKLTLNLKYLNSSNGAVYQVVKSGASYIWKKLGTCSKAYVSQSKLSSSITAIQGNISIKAGTGLDLEGGELYLKGSNLLIGGLSARKNKSGKVIAKAKGKIGQIKSLKSDGSYTQLYGSKLSFGKKVKNVMHKSGAIYPTATYVGNNKYQYGLSIDGTDSYLTINAKKLYIGENKKNSNNAPIVSLGYSGELKWIVTNPNKKSGSTSFDIYLKFVNGILVSAGKYQKGDAMKKALAQK